MNAALVGARELIGPIIAMTITLAAVYTPIALQGGLTGALFREFALTLAGAVFISGVVALTLSPMMSAHLAARRTTPIRDSAGWSIELSIASAIGTAVISIAPCNARPAVYIVWAGISLLALFMFVAIPKVGDEGIGAERRSGRDLRHHHRAGERDHRRHDSLCGCRRESLSEISRTRVSRFKSRSRTTDSAEWF